MCIEIGNESIMCTQRVKNNTIEQLKNEKISFFYHMIRNISFSHYMYKIE